jgi:hypothetical protein
MLPGLQLSWRAYWQSPARPANELAYGLKKPKVPRKKPEKRKIELHEARRSSQVASKTVVVYREQLQRVPVPGARERNERQGLRRRYLTEAAREAAVETAEELLKDIENPAFVMPMPGGLPRI